jgi:hypothetical protein
VTETGERERERGLEVCFVDGVERVKSSVYGKKWNAQARRGLLICIRSEERERVRRGGTECRTNLLYKAIDCCIGVSCLHV